jgi:predicted SAM-dependent methyltransferase
MNILIIIKQRIYSILSIRQRRRYLRHTNVRKLHLGCGKNILDGWLNTDLKFRRNRVSFLDVSKAFPFQNECIDFVFCEHVLEHLTFSQTMNLLRECHRVLRPQGLVRIATPSIHFVFDLLNNGNDPKNRNYVLWAAQKFLGRDGVDYDEYHANIYVISNFFRNFGHRVIHSHESLKGLLLQTGFSKIQQEEIGKSEIPELCMLEQHGRIIPEEFNRLETFVLEARK